ncbi:protein of unknown function (plasmid) [Pararobbsia alpina]
MTWALSKFAEQAVKEPARLAFVATTHAFTENPLVHVIFGCSYEVVARDGTTVLPAALNTLAG